MLQSKLSRYNKLKKDIRRNQGNKKYKVGSFGQDWIRVETDCFIYLLGYKSKIRRLPQHSKKQKSISN